jgi:hypothetical protein
MEKDWWGGGRAVNLLKEKAVEIAEGAKLKKVFWITNHPKHSKRFGFKQSKSVLMEYKIEEENKNGSDTIRESGNADGERQHDDARAEPISSRDTRDGGPSITGSLREFITGV